MPPRLTWSNLIPGVIAIAALAIIGVVALMNASIGKLRGETVRVFVLTDQARGVTPGSEVWLDGQRAGVVDQIAFRPPDRDTLHRVVITIDIGVEAVLRLRRDSRVRVRPGGNVIGPVVVSLESGTPAGAPVGEGDTVRTLVQTDAQLTMARLGPANDQLSALLADARTVMARARRDGTIGALMTHGLPGSEVAALRRNVGALGAMAGGDGDRHAVLMRRAATVLARADSVRALVAAPRSSLGRFRRDSTLARSIGDIARELDSLQRELDEAEGTWPRLQRDSALLRSVAGARVEMRLLFDDVRRRPLRYIHF